MNRLLPMMMVLCGVTVAAPTLVAQETQLIPREVFFGNPERAGLQLSPDGSQIAFIAPVDGVLNVWVGPADNLDAAKPVTKDTHRGIRIFFWTYTNDRIIYLQDSGGDENWRAYSTNVQAGETLDLTPFEGVQAQIQEVSPKHPNELLIKLNKRDPQFHDLFRVNINTGDMTLVFENPGEINGGLVADFLTDDDYRVRLAQTVTEDTGLEILKKTESGWEVLLKGEPADVMSTAPIEFDATGRIAYFVSSVDRDTAALLSIDLETGESALLADNTRADVGRVMIHPTRKTVQAVGFNYERQEWRLLDRSLERDWQQLRRLDDGDFAVTSRSHDDSRWIVAYTDDQAPVRYYLYEPATREAKFLCSDRPALEGLPLAEMRPVVIEARDGKKLVSYYTLPVGADSDGDGAPEQPLPMMLLVHGGPWGRDSWGYNPMHQWLANRGYAVLSVNFRGSTGFGKAFISAGDMEWAAAMHDDLIDGVQWAIERGVADESRIGIMGGSYGGYATLVGLTFTPDTFACGVDIVGPSNLVTLLNTVPPYWRALAQTFRTRVGDVNTEEGRAFLMERSPISRVDAIMKPLLIGQGANDPRVKQAESDQIVEAMQEKNIPVTYVLFPDEGHGFRRPENMMAFMAVTETFLAVHLGGRYEPIDRAFEGSSITIPVGAEEIQGVAAAIGEN